MDKDQNNNYNTQLSDIHLAPSLWWVKRHYIYKETEKMKCELTYPQTSASDLKWIVSEVFAIYDSHFKHIYNYVSNIHTQEVGN